MNYVNIHIDETVNQQDMGILCQQLMAAPHVNDVEVSAKRPHDMLVEFEEHYNMPMRLLFMLKQQGLHADIVGC